MKITKPSSYPKEDDEAKAFASYLKDLQTYKQIVCYSHIPNENSIKNMGYAMKMKSMGKQAGVPDYIIVMKSKVLFIELKRQKNENGTTASSVSPDQELWVNSLNNANCPSKICFGSGDAIRFVQENLSSA